MPKVRKLGSIQVSLLNSLVEHGGWHQTCGWVWDTQSGTERRLDILVKRKLVRKGVRTLPPHGHERMFYEATRKGRELSAVLIAEAAEAYRKTKDQEQRGQRP